MTQAALAQAKIPTESPQPSRKRTVSGSNPLTGST